MKYLKETRFAFRLAGATALPNNGLFFALGGGQLLSRLRSQPAPGQHELGRQRRMAFARGSKRLNWDFCDHVVGVRNIYVARFTTSATAYVNNHSYGPVAHAVGAGLRVDVAWLGLIERTMLRFDVAKTVNDSTPFQFWVGVSHPF